MIVHCYNLQTNTKFTVKSIKELCEMLKHYQNINNNNWDLKAKERAKKAYYQRVRYYLTKATNSGYTDIDLNDCFIIAALDEYALMKQIKVKELWDTKMRENRERIENELQNKGVL